jgi:hypothetical protein
MTGDLAPDLICGYSPGDDGQPSGYVDQKNKKSVDLTSQQLDFIPR